ncbi:hypothetical protein Syn7502_02818 [Synechococcus sp. PCC 7502]|uniref:hypothetical protein n=1 Tax=Synechococcus sp. PCC 7502 TaxID=1173263 RepID=UPI00029FE490|nr:hypothetical protein [Synechococcus sp. PCC 7502]AFY74755.1 hypothetical protein Syn7502_02818 [Synechococcus sp. PCC 7502]
MIKDYLAKQGYFTNLPNKVDCQYSEDCEYCREGKQFICDLCDRSVPWCFGGDDHYGDELCNECWGKSSKLEEEGEEHE